MIRSPDPVSSPDPAFAFGADPAGRDLLCRAVAASRAPIDEPAAAALAEAMAGWSADEVDCYREAVAAEVARLGDRPPDGFLAAEALALTRLDAARLRGLA